MIRVIARRLIGGLLTVFFVYALTFLMVVTVPGQRFSSGQRNLAPEIESALRIRYNLDNHWDYFWQYLSRAVRLDFGPSFSYVDWTCNQIIADALPVSMTIGLLAIALALCIGVPVGVLGAVRRHSLFDVGTLGVILLGISVPTFVTGTFMLIVFAVLLPLAPIGGWGTLAHLPLPVITLSLPFTAYIARLTRVSMLDVMSADFIRTGLAMGLPRQHVIWNQALRVAILPVISYLGPATAQAITGSFVVERVFGVPGLGQHFVNAALNVDPGLILGTVLVFSTILVVMNLLTDVLYAWVDPRVAGAV